MFTNIDFPGAVSTYPRGINNLGQVVGYYQDMSGYNRAFVYDAGNFTPFDYPDAVHTWAWGINNAGRIVGSYLDRNGKRHGFLYNGVNSITVDYPGAVATDTNSINDLGQIVGEYYLPGGVQHGFLASPATLCNSDNDGDGFSENQGDCNDTDPNIYPGATEICGDCIDNN